MERIINQHNKLLCILSLIKGIGPAALVKFEYYFQNNKINLDNYEVDDIRNIILEVKAPRVKVVSDDLIEQAIDKYHSILKSNLEYGIHLIGKESKWYPKTLLELDKVKKMKAPFFLYVKGNIECLNQKSIAVIGTRDISEHGKTVIAGLIKKYLTNTKKYVVVSGLAKGCDTVAHECALYSKAPTIAILPCGLDQVYPKENIDLAKNIINTNGALVSEYPIGTKTTKFNLVDRDRIQAGIASGTLIIETKEKGGTMHAAKVTEYQNKPRACFQTNELDQYKDQWENHDNYKGNKLLISQNEWLGIINEESIKEFIKRVDEYIPSTEIKTLFQ